MLTIFKEQAYINGQWVDASERQAVHNPATGACIGYVPAMGAQQAEQAIEAAQIAWPAWRALSAGQRSQYLRRWFTLIMEHQEALAQLLTAEQGKPLKEARAEIAYGASYVEWYAEEAKRLYGETIPGPNAHTRIIVQPQPVGVCAAITPWNFPNAMITRKVAPALAAGCTFVLRPASQTPFSALALVALAHEAGIPPGVLNVITGPAAPIAQVLTQSPLVRKFSFTGSTDIGRQLMQACASTVKKVSLELGGNAPFIVLDDADLDAAVQGLMVAKFRNAGQTCVCANRIYVHSAVYDAFADKLAQAMATLQVGNGNDPDSDLGPLIDDAAVRNTLELLADAQAKGATVVGRGYLHDRFFAPVLLKNATSNMRVSTEEIFAPLAPLYRFEDDAQVLAMANDSEYGLAAYVYGNQLSRLVHLMEGLEYGMVGVNTGLISNAVAPFGGVKQSGLDREGARQGLLAYIDWKYICLGV